jgi:hypothetical protein
MGSAPSASRSICERQEDLRATCEGRGSEADKQLLFRMARALADSERPQRRVFDIWQLFGHDNLLRYMARVFGRWDAQGQCVMRQDEEHRCNDKSYVKCREVFDPTTIGFVWKVSPGAALPYMMLRTLNTEVPSAADPTPPFRAHISIRPVPAEHTADTSNFHFAFDHSRARAATRGVLGSEHIGGVLALVMDADRDEQPLRLSDEFLYELEQVVLPAVFADISPQVAQEEAQRIREFLASCVRLLNRAYTTVPAAGVGERIAKAEFIDPLLAGVPQRLPYDGVGAVQPMFRPREMQWPGEKRVREGPGASYPDLPVGAPPPEEMLRRRTKLPGAAGAGTAAAAGARPGSGGSALPGVPVDDETERQRREAIALQEEAERRREEVERQRIQREKEERLESERRALEAKKARELEMQHREREEQQAQERRAELQRQTEAEEERKRQLAEAGRLQKEARRERQKAAELQQMAKQEVSPDALSANEFIQKARTDSMAWPLFRSSLDATNTPDKLLGPADVLIEAMILLIFRKDESQGILVYNMPTIAQERIAALGSTLQFHSQLIRRDHWFSEIHRLMISPGYNPSEGESFVEWIIGSVPESELDERDRATLHIVADQYAWGAPVSLTLLSHEDFGEAALALHHMLLYDQDDYVKRMATYIPEPAETPAERIAMYARQMQAIFRRMFEATHQRSRTQLLVEIVKFMLSDYNPSQRSVMVLALGFELPVFRILDAYHQILRTVPEALPMDLPDELMRYMQASVAVSANTRIWEAERRIDQRATSGLENAKRISTAVVRLSNALEAVRSEVWNNSPETALVRNLLSGMLVVLISKMGVISFDDAIKIARDKFERQAQELKRAAADAVGRELILQEEAARKRQAAQQRGGAGAGAGGGSGGGRKAGKGGKGGRSR